MINTNKALDYELTSVIIVTDLATDIDIMTYRLTNVGSLYSSSWSCVFGSPFSKNSLVHFLILGSVSKSEGDGLYQMSLFYF